MMYRSAINPNEANNETTKVRIFHVKFLLPLIRQFNRPEIFKFNLSLYDFSNYLKSYGSMGQ